jgi:hypothetical protein
MTSLDTDSGPSDRHGAGERPAAALPDERHRPAALRGERLDMRVQPVDRALGAVRVHADAAHRHAMPAAPQPRPQQRQ